MVWTLLPLGLVVILVMGMLLAASAFGNKLGRPAREELRVAETKERGLMQGKRFAIVDEQALLPGGSQTGPSLRFCRRLFLGGGRRNHRRDACGYRPLLLSSSSFPPPTISRTFPNLSISRYGSP
jgi:hypothetical protein